MRFDDNRKVARVLVAAGILAYAGWAYIFTLQVPRLARLLAASDGTFAVLLCLAEGAGLLLAVAIGFYIAICRRIGNGRSFTRENARDLGRISVLLLCAAAVFVSVPLFTGFDEHTMLIAVIGLMVAAVSVLAWALGKLVTHAAALKEENDLTI